MINNSVSFVLKRLLKENKISIDEKELEFQFVSHPSYPSLHSLTGVLDHFKVSNLAIEIPKTDESISVLPQTFIAHIKKEEEYFALVYLIDDNFIIQYNKNEKETVSKEEFFNIWSGIIVAIENEGHENVVKSRHPVFKKALLILSMLSLVGLFFSDTPTLFQSLQFLFSLIGIVVCVLIVQHETGLQSAILDKFCTGNSDKTSCDDVLNSKGATLFFNIKLSLIGLTYFTATCMAWFFLSFFSSPNYNALIGLSALAVPFTLFSIYYQVFKVKKWCPLCLSVVFTLWAQAVLLIFPEVNLLNIAFDIDSNTLIATCFLVCTSIFSFVLPKLEEEKELKEVKIEHHRFKHNYNIFESLLFKNPAVNTGIDIPLEIVFNKQLNHTAVNIIVITNPLCGHCADAHNLVEQLLTRNIPMLEICIRFNVNVKDINAIDTKIAMRLLEIHNSQAKDESRKALHEVYSGMDREQWLANWGTCSNSKYLDVLKEQSAWCSNNMINFTPEILLNGKSFPMEFQRSDLMFFIDEYMENELEKTESLRPHEELTI